MENFKKNRKKLFIVLTLLLVIFVAIGGYFKFSENNEISSNESNALVVPTILYTDEVFGSRVQKGSQLMVTGHISYLGNKTYYHRSDFYSDNTLMNEGTCRELNPDNDLKLLLFMNQDKMYATTTIFSDEKCNKKVIKYRTKTYRINSVGISSDDEEKKDYVLKTFTATFDKNLADKVSKEKASCTTIESSCQVKASSITKEGHNIIGWSTDKNATTTQYKVGEAITLTKDTTFYAITSKKPGVKKTFTAKFNKNGADSIGATQLSCTTIGNSCTVKAPSIIKANYIIKGWGTSFLSKDAKYKVGDSITLTKDTTFYAITEKNQVKTKKFTATFNKNGATSIEFSKLTCNTTSTSCAVKAPSITRNGYSVLGWDTNKNATSAKYKVGDNITLTKDTTFYAITKKKTSGATTVGTITMTKFNSTWDKLASYGILNVQVTPSSATYTVTSSNPKVMKVYNVNNNWKLVAVGDGTATITATSSTGAKISHTYTVNSGEKTGKDRTLKGLKKYEYKDGVDIYSEKGCKDNVIKSYMADFDESPQYVKDTVSSIYILTRETFSKLNPGFASNVVGLASGSINRIQVVCDKYSIGALPHEMGHTMDFTYRDLNGMYFSDTKDFIKIYNKYSSKNDKPLTPYAYSNTLEFFAEAYTMYFQKNIAKTNTIDKGYFKNYKITSDISKLIKDALNKVEKFNFN